MILDRDKRVLQVGAICGDRHVVALFVETEPAAAVGGVKPRVADAAGELVDRVALRGEPAERSCGDNDEREQQVLGPAQISTPASQRIISIVP